MKKEINIFWFKRDLRINDNEALCVALNSELPLLLVYILEPSLLENNHYSQRHFDFIKETLSELKIQLQEMKCHLLCIESEADPFFEYIFNSYKVNTLFSTQESGIAITYRRDLEIKILCDVNQIVWREFQNSGVVRGMRNRDQWREKFYSYMTAPLFEPKFKDFNFLPSNEINEIEGQFKLIDVKTTSHSFQKGGRTEAIKCAESFFNERIAYYSEYISKPLHSRYGCSRLSPYFAWGVLSIREIYQKAQNFKKETNFKKQVNAFCSRLRWQSHFIQKFEMEMRMEFEAVNKGFLNFEQPINEEYINAWKNGTTGYPLVDASQRCVAQTGYLNFRMRSLVTSFLTHHLFQHFTTGAPWLAQQFLDFEPGIHYGQMQMQAGLTGINTVRIYNPTKNAIEHDPNADFIKKYLPELKELPNALAIEPWKVSLMEEEMYNFKYGETYPERIVNIEETRKFALKKIYDHRKLLSVKDESERILNTHTLHKTESRFP